MTQRRIYPEDFPYFVTFRTREGFALFEGMEMVELLACVIFKTCKMKQFDVLAFQIMSDHVHLLVNTMLPPHPAVGAVYSKNGSAPSAGHARRFTITDVIHGIKSYFIKQIRIDHNIPFSIWQRRFYTRIVNTDKYLRTIIEYIKHNPVKAELPRQYHRLPYQYFCWKKIRHLF